MKKYLLIVAILSSFLAACGESDCNKEKSDNDEKVANNESVKIISIKDFDSLAATMVGEKVLVKGLVDHVCKHGGKKLFLVKDDAHLRVMHKERFNDSLVGGEVSVVGMVKEFRIDENYCEDADEKNSKALSEGKKTQEQFDDTKEHVSAYRDSMKTAGVDHLSFYSLEFVEFK